MRPLQLADRVLGVASLPFAASGAYLGVLSVLSMGGGKRAAPPDLSVRFVFVVPAHNEAVGVADTVKSLLAVDYPPDRFRVVVVADNCSDDTAARAKAAGAEVLERHDSSKRGKGYALDFAFRELLADEVAAVHAVVVVDADTRVAPNLLRAFSARIGGGAQALQASYRVANSAVNWRTALMSIAFSCMHDVRSIGRERVGLSAGLRGNGMCFTAPTLRTVPHAAASLVEDVEHGIDLAEHGIRVVFVADAFVEAEMPERADNAASQRERWEKGRSMLRRQRGPQLIADAVRKGDPVRADLAVDLFIPPLAQLAVGLVGCAGATSVSRWAGGRRLSPAPATLFGLAGLGVHVAAGWRSSGTGRAGLRALGHVPPYIAWKLGLRRGRSGLGSDSAGADEWVRTTRNAETDSAHRVHGTGPQPMSSRSPQ